MPSSIVNDRISGHDSITDPHCLGRRPTIYAQELTGLVQQFLRMVQIGNRHTPLQAANITRYLAENCKDKPHLMAIGEMPCFRPTLPTKRKR